MLPNALCGPPWTPRGEGEAWGCVGSAFGHVVVTRYSREKGFLGAVRGFGGEPGAWVQNDLRPGMCPARYFYWNPLWRPPDGEEFIVSREQETKFDKEKVTSLGTPSFRAHWK